MIKEFLSHLHWSILPVVTMFMFLSVFLGAVAWVFRKGSSEEYRKISNILFSKENL